MRARTRLSCSLGVATLEGRREGRLRPAQAGRAHRRPARPRGGAFLAPFPIRLLPGVGPRAEERLVAAGIVDDRRHSRRSTTTRCARVLQRQGRTRAPGPRARIDPRPLEVSIERISISNEETSRRTSATPSGCTTSCGAWPIASPSTSSGAARSRGRSRRSSATRTLDPDASTSLPVGTDDAGRIGELACGLLDRAPPRPARDRSGSSGSACPASSSSPTLAAGRRLKGHRDDADCSPRGDAN